MKLFEIAGPEYPNFPIFAWLEPSNGPEDIRGVRLAYIEPTKARHEHNLANATAANDERWINNVKRMGADLAKSGQSYYTPDLGWWQSEQDFYGSKEGVSGLAGMTAVRGPNVETLKAKYPDLHILKSREEAVAAAKQAGLI
jgi:hypothetical protein